jgi:alanyl-tRNA synthetase
MNARRYYDDAYTTEFTAHVQEQLTHAGQPAVVLDASYFYPASGGQPADRGMLNGVAVADVIVREADGAVVHVLDAPLDAGPVTGVIDWPRRFDHMQHHTGQHILTQAFIRAADAPTVSFHLGVEIVTIDVDRADIPPTLLDEVETLANAIVAQNAPVRAWFPTPAELADLPVRRVPDVNGKLRVVGIGTFDFTACGGTHVAHSAEVGLIKVLRTEKYKGMTRVTFCCGDRARHDYTTKHAILADLAADLTTGYWEIGEAVARLQAENKALRADLKAARQALLVSEAAELWDAASPQHDARIIARAWVDRDAAELRPLASHLVARAGTIALLGLAGEKAQIVMACADDLMALDMVSLLRAAIGTLTGDPDSRRGGGRPSFAQGGGISADQSALQAVLDQAARDVLSQLT